MKGFWVRSVDRKGFWIPFEEYLENGLIVRSRRKTLNILKRLYGKESVKSYLRAERKLNNHFKKIDIHVNKGGTKK